MSKTHVNKQAKYDIKRIDAKEDDSRVKTYFPTCNLIRRCHSKSSYFKTFVYMKTSRSPGIWLYWAINKTKQINVSVFIIRSLTTLSKVYKYQNVCEILTLEKRNNMKKRYTNEILHGIYLCLGVSGTTTTTRSQTRRQGRRFPCKDIFPYL
jgi:hypothetical protein